ncbi:MAG TPA: DNA mismatch repair protein MutS [Thermoanaerobaculia bacterium]|nr:DNA mismatch repair protein MutS [Thermoanaerobaculia bacterium]
MATTPKHAGEAPAADLVLSRATPMLRQYFEMKSRVPDAILFYRMGDFYEMFFEDAKEAAPLLGIALTARHRDSDIEAPMCGVPWHSADHHIARLISAGRKVAICDQVEDPRAARGLVRRDITRIVTPGTVLDPESLLPGAASYLAAVVAADADRAGVAFLDYSTGQFHAGTIPLHRLPDALALFRPREVLLPEGSDLVLPAGIPLTRRSAEWFVRVGPGNVPPASPVTALGAQAAAAARAYAEEMRPGGIAHVADPTALHFGERMGLDASAIATLEIFESSDGSAERSLCALLDRTRTPLGARALKDALARPSTDPVELEARWDSVEELSRRADERQRLRRALDDVGDLERRFARIATGTAGPREVAAWAAGLRAVPAVLSAGAALVSSRLRAVLDGIPDSSDLVRRVEETLAPEPPVLASAGGAIRDEADRELASLRSLRRDGQGALLAIEAEERKRSGIPNLRIRYNRVFGYSLEVGKAHREGVPADWIRRQSLANAERFVTPALKDLEEKILGAEERIGEIEGKIYAELLRELGAAADRSSKTAAAVAELDLHAGFAEVAASGRWVRPRLSGQRRLSIADGRHPIVETLRREEAFVPNDCELSSEKRILLVTGPNMGGKSTYLRQVATCVLLAQAGSFVPAARAEMPIVDRIFTRVGAADHLSRGESTFMVEMLEAAAILREATPRSLVILDEVGRGTSTFDGLSIAWALVEHLHDMPEKGTFVLFATHYHELTEIALVRPGVANATMAVKELNGKVVFLRKVIAGSADRSYGIHVAELAGLPRAVIERAREILSNLEKQELDVQGAPVLARHDGESAGEGQMLLFSAAEELVLEKLRQVDVNNLTPVSALSLLASLQDRLKRP